MMVDPWIHGTADPVHADDGGYNCPIAAVFAGGECGAAKSVVAVSKIGTKAKDSSDGPDALVLHSEILDRLARSPVLCPAQDRNDLAEEAIPRLLARAKSVD
jgi:hypothetical protein